MRPLFYCFSLLLLLSIYLPASGQEQDSKRNSYQVLPSGFYTPETNIGLGIIGLYYHNPGDSLTRQSNAQLYFDFTLNNQFLFQGDANWYSPGNKYYLKWSHDISRFPEIFHGIGNETEVSDACHIDFKLLNFSLKAFRKLKKNTYVGVIAEHQTLNDVMKESHGVAPPVLMDYSYSGLGFEFLVDQRDFILNPQKGKYIELGLEHFHNYSGMPGFYKAVADLRWYHTIKSKWVINTNVYAIQCFGDVPFRMMPSIGGPRLLRGFYYGRFRDKNLTLTQAELRRDLFWRIGAAVFGGFGQVYPDFQSFNMNSFHYNYGAGIRFRLHEDSRANVRLDYGRTKDSHGIYIVFGEAF